MSTKAAMRLLDTIDDCLKHPYDNVQRAAAAALRSVAAACCVKRVCVLVCVG